MKPKFLHFEVTEAAPSIYAPSIMKAHARRTRRLLQQELRLAPRARDGSRRGGARPGSGRKPNVPGAPGVSHRTRPTLSEKHPVHVTLRLRREVPNLRRNAFLPVVTDALRASSDQFGFRLCHYVVMGNHLHLVVEADDASCLARGLQGLTIRLAKRLNRAARRHGKFFADRYHAHILRTPTEVHRALAYVLLNQRKHAAERHPDAPLNLTVDAFSSGAWFDAWQSPPRGLRRLRDGPPPVVLTPRSWLLREGWKKAGQISAA
jgi:REP element-mobilizing transposase RayT